jgi:DNA-binding transcriptional LysR family regulator
MKAIFAAAMELRHLRYFVAVAEEQNVTRAAARLHVSQPPLTRQIRDLEEELGIRLFDRIGKSISLTHAGRVFLREARAALARVEEAVTAARTTAQDQQGELHLGYAPSPTTEILPLLLRALHKHAPRVRVVLHDHSSPEMLAGLRTGPLHAALMMQPTRQAARGLRFEPLREYPIGVLAASGHPFTRRRTVQLAEILAEQVVVLARAEYPDYHEFIARILGEAVKHLHISEECDSGSSLMAAVAAGKGVAISASILATAAGRRLRYIALHPPPPPAVVGIAYRPTAETPLLRELLETARSLGRSQVSANQLAVGPDSCEVRSR